MTEEKYFPGIGHLSVQYYGIAREIFYMLNTHGLIEELTNIYQIGSLHNLYTSRHRRDEYVELQVALVVKLRQLTGEQGKFPGMLGLSYRQNNLFPFPATRAEILQSIILLQNTGHISGTFACEAGLLQVLVEDKDKYSRFRKALPTIQAKKYFDKIFKTFDVMNFHKVLTYFKLSGIRSDTKFKGKCFQILDWYLDSSRERDSVDLIFQKCRLLSFMFLDLQHSSVPFNLPLDQVIKNWENNLSGWFEKESSISKFLSSMNVEISKHLYHRDEAAPYKNTAFKHAYLYFSNLKPFVRDLRKGLKNYTYSETPQGNHICLAFETKNLQTAFEAKNHFLHSNISGLFIERINEKEKPDILISFCATKDDGDYKVTFRSLAFLLHAVIETLEPSQRDRVLKDVTLNVLQQLFDCPIEGIPKPYDYQNTFLVQRGAKGSVFKLRQKIKTLKTIDEDRKHQIKILADALELQKFRGYVIAFLGEINLINKDNNQTVTDLDGIALLVNKSKLSVLITEAKNQHRGSRAKALNDLKRVFEVLHLKTDYQIDSINQGSWSLIE